MFPNSKSINSFTEQGNHQSLWIQWHVLIAFLIQGSQEIYNFRYLHYKSSNGIWTLFRTPATPLSKQWVVRSIGFCLPWTEHERSSCFWKAPLWQDCLIHSIWPVEAGILCLGLLLLDCPWSVLGNWLSFLEAQGTMAVFPEWCHQNHLVNCLLPDVCQGLVYQTSRWDGESLPGFPVLKEGICCQYVWIWSPAEIQWELCC